MHSSHNQDAMPLIRLSGVTKTFPMPGGGMFTAVAPTSLDIGQGQIFGLIGRSGAGKSTLLRMINLLERPDNGQVLLEGRDLTQLSTPELRLARQNLGMIFQQFNLLQNATVYENVAFPLTLHGRFGRKELKSRVQECLALVGLTDKAEHYPAQLSGGQKQRVAIARALAPRPKVMLCDEPTSALDAETTRSVLHTLRDINEKLGVTIVIVTHELSVVQTLCTRVAVLEHGELVEQFDTDDQSTERLSALGKELEKERLKMQILKEHSLSASAGLAAE
ncbi:methionine ABC transporter ATP-binding protein [Parapusillimonas sp. JC17]|uniref:methionine ABC transporter ATP-binding protein n=1 Tax=Parapusillimonas sp. JC17 TaxID=3445768 RepID=UPI003F9FDC69